VPPLGVSVADIGVTAPRLDLADVLPLARRDGAPGPGAARSGAARSGAAVTNPERNESGYPTVIYSATEAAVSMLTVEYAKALADMFNTVGPGFTANDLISNGAGQTAAETEP